MEIARLEGERNAKIVRLEAEKKAVMAEVVLSQKKLVQKEREDLRYDVARGGQPGQRHRGGHGLLARRAQGRAAISH